MQDYCELPDIHTTHITRFQLGFGKASTANRQYAQKRCKTLCFNVTGGHIETLIKRDDFGRPASYLPRQTVVHSEPPRSGTVNMRFLCATSFG